MRPDRRSEHTDRTRLSSAAPFRPTSAVVILFDSPDYVTRPSGKNTAFSSRSASSGPPEPAPDQPVQTEPDPRLAITPIQPGSDKVHPEKFEDILQPAECLNIVVVRIDIERIGPAHQVPVPAAKYRDLVGQESVEVMLEVPCRVECGGRAVRIVRRQLKAVEIFAGKERLVAGKMLVILDINRPGIEK